MHLYIIGRNAQVSSGPRAAHKYNYSLGRDSRSKRTEKAHSDTRAQLERRSSTRSPAGSPRPLETPATKGMQWLFSLQVGRASTAPKQYLAGIYLKLHLMRCQRSREGLLEDLLFMLAGTPPIDGCRAGSWWHKQKGFIVQWRGARSSAL